MSQENERMIEEIMFTCETLLQQKIQEIKTQQEDSESNNNSPNSNDNKNQMQIKDYHHSQQNIQNGDNQLNKEKGQKQNNLIDNQVQNMVNSKDEIKTWKHNLLSKLLQKEEESLFNIEKISDLKFKLNIEQYQIIANIKPTLSIQQQMLQVFQSYKMFKNSLFNYPSEKRVLCNILNIYTGIKFQQQLGGQIQTKIINNVKFSKMVFIFNNYTDILQFLKYIYQSLLYYPKIHLMVQKQLLCKKCAQKGKKCSNLSFQEKQSQKSKLYLQYSQIKDETLDVKSKLYRSIMDKFQDINIRHYQEFSEVCLVEMGQNQIENSDLVLTTVDHFLSPEINKNLLNKTNNSVFIFEDLVDFQLKQTNKQTQ